MLMTTGAITGSRKIYRDAGDGLRVPARRVELTNGEHLDLYDTSGPYTDPDAAIDVLRSGRADAYAENAHMLSLYSERLPGSRVLQGRYTVIQHAIATQKGKPAAAEFVEVFVEESKRDGTVRGAITQAGLRRTDVAPAAATK